jgi:hypothetical protein
MRATGEKGATLTRLSTTCRHLKLVVGRYRADFFPFAVVKVRTSQVR